MQLCMCEIFPLENSQEIVHEIKAFGIEDILSLILSSLREKTIHFHLIQMYKTGIFKAMKTISRATNR